MKAYGVVLAMVVKLAMVGVPSLRLRSRRSGWGISGGIRATGGVGDGVGFGVDDLALWVGMRVEQPSASGCAVLRSRM